MASEETKILEIKVETSDAIKKIVAYREKVDELKASEKQLKELYIEKKIDERVYREEMEKSRIKTMQYNEAIRLLTKEVNNNIRSDNAKSTSLRGLRAALSNVTAEYDNLSREEREAAAGRQLLDKINNITNELKEAEEATQRYYRNVGNYKSVWNGLGMSIQQVARELPSLTIGFNTFFLAISNNLPMLADEIARARKEYVELIKAGQKATPVWKQILSSIFSWQTALVAGVTLLSMYGKEIMNWVGSLFKGKEAIDDMYMSTEEFQKAVGDSLGKTISELERMSSEWVGLGKNIDAQNKYVEKNKKNFERLGISIENVSDAENAFVMNKDAFIESIKERAKAAALMDIASEKYAEATRKMMEAEAMPEKKTYKTYQGSLFHGEWVTRTYDNKERQEAIKEAEKIQKEADRMVEKSVEIDNKGKELLKSVGIKEFEDVTKKVKSIVDATDKELQAIREMEDALTDIIKANKEIERSKVAESYDKDIEALKDRLQAEKNLTEEAQNQILETIKAKEKEKAEAVARVSIIDADLEEERQRTILAYDREIEDLKKRMDTEKDLTAKAREAILETIKAKEVQKENELDKLNDEAASRELERQMKLVQLKLDGVKAETEQEHNLRMKQLELQRESELASKDLTEQMKLAIVKKYEKLMNDEAVRYVNETAKKQAEAIELQFETAIAKAYDNELEVARLQMEQKKASLDAIQQMEGESLEAFNLRKIQAENEYLDAKKDVAAKEIEIEQGKLQAMSDITGGLISLVEAIGESDKAAAVASKVLALAQIAIETGKAISKMVSAEAGKGIAGIATMATGIATILANIATAIKTVKSAKFATGGDVTGAGTATSDSIPAMLSNGESVLTAKATNMFAPILSAFNQAGGGVPIHGQQTGNQAMGEDMLARAFAKGVAGMPNPIVSVEEITNVTKRVQVIENINRI